MRYTTPWLPSPRPSRDDDELSGSAISLAVTVGAIVRRYGEPVSSEVICIALAGLFGAMLDRLDEPELVSVISTAVLLAKAFGLIEMTSNGYWVATRPEP